METLRVPVVSMWSVAGSNDHETPCYHLLTSPTALGISFELDRAVKLGWSFTSIAAIGADLRELGRWPMTYTEDPGDEPAWAVKVPADSIVWTLWTSATGWLGLVRGCVEDLDPGWTLNALGRYRRLEPVA